MNELLRIFRLVAACFVASAHASSSCAAPLEIAMQDAQGMPAWLYVPRRIDKDRTYWLAVGVHALGGNGRGAAGLAMWADQGDVIVLGPTFADGYQAGEGVHAEKFIALVKEAARHYKLHPKIFLHGFSAGAQFAHRFTFRNPTLVAGVSAHSGGSWDPPNPAAKDIPWAVSCGEADTDRSTPLMPLNRIDGFRAFAAALQQQGFDVTAKTFPGVGHQLTPAVGAMAFECLNQVRRAGAAPPKP